MAAGPLGRIIAQAVILGISILSRALPAAYAQALQNAKKGGGAATTTQQILRKTIAKDEALQILNLSEKELTADAIQKVIWIPVVLPTLFFRFLCTRLTWK
jgi:import inner membrane translocase subunit TIM16